MQKTKYELFLEMLQNKGIIDGIRTAVNFVEIPPFVPKEVHESIIKKSIAEIIVESIKSDKELKQAFDTAATELIFQRLFKDIGTEKDNNFQPTEQQKLTNDIAQLILAAMFKK